MLAATTHVIQQWNWQTIAAICTIVALGVGALRWFIKSEMRSIKSEITPNGGSSSSLGDVVLRIERKTDQAAELAATASTKVSDLARLFNAHLVVDEAMHAQLLEHLKEPDA